MAYPADIVKENDRVVGYLTAALKAGVDSVRYIVNLPEYLDILSLDELPVNMDAPDENQSYPYVHVMYKHKSMEPASLKDDGHVFTQLDNDYFALYKFRGEFAINLYATTILERESIADILIGAIAIDPRFTQKLVDNPWINIAPNLATYDSLTSNESWGTPWSEDTMTCFRQMSFSVQGEFLYRYDTSGSFISKINILQTLQ